MPVFPTTYSTLSPDALAQFVASQYGFENVHGKLIIRGIGDTYRIDTDSGPYILRVYRTDQRSEANIIAETELLTAAHKAGISVSYPLPDKGEKTIQSLNAAEGTRHAVLFTYAPGQSVIVLNELQLQNLGTELAKFHNLSAYIQLKGERWEYNLHTLLHRPMELLRDYFANDPEGYAWLQQAVKEIEIGLSRLDTSTFSTGYCHFDVLPKNFYFDGDNITLFDFDFLGLGWLVLDIMTFYQQLLLDVQFGRLTKEAADNSYATFLDAYCSVRALSDDEIAAVPYLGLGFWLYYSAFSTTHDEFYTFIQPSHLKQRYAMVRRMMEMSWPKVLAHS